MIIRVVNLTCLFLVVSTERLILWRSEIFGGICNEISGILDQSTLLKDMQGILFRVSFVLIFHKKFKMQQKAT